MLVVDASALAPAVADGGADGDRFRARLRGEGLAGPDLLRVEVVSVLRRHLRAGLLTTAQAGAAVDDLIDLPLSVFPAAPLLGRAWTLRGSFTASDACCVSLPKHSDVPSSRPTADSPARLAPAAPSR